MTGWRVSVFRQAQERSVPATADSVEGRRLAVWQTNSGGLLWLDALVNTGAAVALGGDGYPNRYTARARQLISTIESGPPKANETWVYGPDDVLSAEWEGRTVVDHDAIHACDPDEWLLVVAWDES